MERTDLAPYAALFEAIPIGLYRRTPDGRLLDVNPALVTAAGYPDRAALLAKRVADLYVDPGDAVRFEQAMREDGFVRAFETRMRRFDGSPVWVEVNAVAVRDGDGRVAWYEGTLTSISRRKEMETELRRNEQQLRAILVEKDALLKEVHHRVKNNLQIISSLLNLQFDRVQDPELRAMVHDSRQRILAMALVHEQLYRSDTLMRLDTGVFLHSLVSSLVRSYATPAQPVDALVEAAPVPLDLDVAISIALVINELVSNSLKHAFTGRASGNRLEVRLRPGADGRRELMVSDNGVGVPTGFDLARASTLGLSLVTNLVRQIGGAVECRTEGGAEFRVSF